VENGLGFLPRPLLQSQRKGPLRRSPVPRRGTRHRLRRGPGF